MAQAPAPDDHQPDQHSDHRHHPEVAPARQVCERLAHLLIEPARAQVVPQQLQPRIRREADVPEFKRQIAIDTGTQIGFLRRTVGGLSVVGERFGSHLLSTTLEGLFQLQSVILRSEK